MGTEQIIRRLREARASRWPAKVRKVAGAAGILGALTIGVLSLLRLNQRQDGAMSSHQLADAGPAEPGQDEPSLTATYGAQAPIPGPESTGGGDDGDAAGGGEQAAFEAAWGQETPPAQKSGAKLVRPRANTSGQRSADEPKAASAERNEGSPQRPGKPMPANGGRQAPRPREHAASAAETSRAPAAAKRHADGARAVEALSDMQPQPEAQGVLRIEVAGRPGTMFVDGKRIAMEQSWDVSLDYGEHFLQVRVAGRTMTYRLHLKDAGVRVVFDEPNGKIREEAWRPSHQPL